MVDEHFIRQHNQGNEEQKGGEGAQKRPPATEIQRQKYGSNDNEEISIKIGIAKTRKHSLRKSLPPNERIQSHPPHARREQAVVKILHKSVKDGYAKGGDHPTQQSSLPVQSPKIRNHHKGHETVKNTTRKLVQTALAERRLKVRDNARCENGQKGSHGGQIFFRKRPTFFEEKLECP
ncbi:MAG: hypothetical protein KA044_07085, partial [Elusimicrobia bacterium]|nr:hypothetical protein [Elusimicrobiota bacterium]